MSTAATAAPLPHPLVTTIDARQSPGPPSPSKEVRDVRLLGYCTGTVHARNKEIGNINLPSLQRDMHEAS